MVKKTIHDFIVESNDIHNNKYDYSLVDYINSKIKVKIICPSHGVFEQTPNSHLQRRGCMLCSHEKTRTKNNDFIEKSKVLHNNKYDYSKVIYINNKTKVEIICPIHGIYYVLPTHHLNGVECKKCYYDKMKMSKQDFIKKANMIHENKYDYSKVVYINSKTKVEIICPIHGIYKQTPHHHLNGSSCKKCRQSKGENEIETFLLKKKIIFETQKKIEKCKDKRELPFDFYLPDYNLCIEYDGEQHFKNNEFFGGEDAFKIRQKHDKIKNDFCEENNINLLRISYKQFNEVEDLIYNYIEKIKE